MASDSDDAEFVLLLGVDTDLFKTCFGQDTRWEPCKLESLDEGCTKEEATAALARHSLLSVVVQDEKTAHWDAVKSYYENGGLVVWFGIYGEFSAPGFLSREFGARWRFSAYTNHEYVLTEFGKEILGDAITEQQYTKSNLLDVPENERILVPKGISYEEYVEDGYDSDDGECDHDAMRAKYDIYIQGEHSQVPIGMHQSKNNSGGRIVYLGFVNGDGNVPSFVRALCTGKKAVVKEG
jgi:hypothetical protein